MLDAMQLANDITLDKLRESNYTDFALFKQWVDTERFIAEQQAKLTLLIWKLDNGKCQYCAKPTIDTKTCQECQDEANSLVFTESRN